MTRPARIRWTIQLRLTLTYGALFLLAGAALLAITYGLAARFTFGAFTPPAMPTSAPISAPTSIPTSIPAAVPGLAMTPPAFGTSPLSAAGVPSPQELAARLAAQRDQELRGLLTASGIALLVMTVVSVGLGWIMARRALRPLRTMAATAREISERNLHRRLGVRGPRDEIKALADTFDGLLGRLEGAFEAQRRFVANASHELRTPIALARSLLEIALADPDASPADLRETCRRVLASNEHEERLIEALLTLARSQRGLDQRAALDLAAVAAELLQAGRPRTGTRCGVDADLDPAWTEGDGPLIERLIGNLVDNAVRHNVDGGWVRISTGTYAGRPALQVVNSGPVVPPERVGALFQPFQRMAADRTDDDGHGLGLGLPIVGAIVAAHGADLDVSPRPEGGLDIRIGFRPAPRQPVTWSPPPLAGSRRGAESRRRPDPVS